MLERYLRVKGLAEALGEGKEMRHRLLGSLAQQENCSTLVEIYPQEEEINQIIQTVRRIGRYYAEPYLLRAAQAAEGACRQQALALHQDPFLHQIAHAKRGA